MLAATLACLSAAAVACPLCLGALQQTKAQQLVAAQQAVRAVPTADAGRFRVVEVVKGERPAGATILIPTSLYRKADGEKDKELK